MKQFILLLCAACFAVSVNAQDREAPDYARILKPVVVKAYEQNRQLKEISAAINYVDKSQLERYNNTSVLPALNATPGVRMEERSPGSYRLNIRGSSLRSPFGVRNVKVYCNQLLLMPPSKLVPRSASRSALITVVDGSTSCVVGGENPSDTLAYNKTPGIIFFQCQMVGKSYHQLVPI